MRLMTIELGDDFCGGDYVLVETKNGELVQVWDESVEGAEVTPPVYVYASRASFEAGHDPIRIYPQR